MCLNTFEWFYVFCCILAQLITTGDTKVLPEVAIPQGKKFWSAVSSNSQPQWKNVTAKKCLNKNIWVSCLCWHHQMILNRVRDHSILQFHWRHVNMLANAEQARIGDFSKNCERRTMSRHPWPHFNLVDIPHLHFFADVTTLLFENAVIQYHWRQLECVWLLTKALRHWRQHELFEIVKF